MMPVLIGVGLGLLVCSAMQLLGFSRDRAFYPTVVVASYYVLFAVMGGSSACLVTETVIMGRFVTLAATGFKMSPWLVVAGLAGHGVLDFFHDDLVANAGVPAYWPPFCLAFDVTAAVWLAWLILRGGSRRSSDPGPAAGQPAG